MRLRVTTADCCHVCLRLSGDATSDVAPPRTDMANHARSVTVIRMISVERKRGLAGASRGEVPAVLTVELAVNTFHVAAAQGLDTALLWEVPDAGRMSSPISRVESAKIVDQDWAPQAALDDVLINGSLITDATRAAGTASPLLDVCRDLCAEGVERRRRAGRGRGGADDHRPERA